MEHTVSNTLFLQSVVATRNLQKCKGDNLHGIPITVRLVRTLTGQASYVDSLEYVHIYKIT